MNDFSRRPDMDRQFSRHYEGNYEKAIIEKNERSRISAIIEKEKKLNSGDVNIQRVLNHILNGINLFP
jgi:DNA polymerase sigma